jgi:O-antigen ligase
MMRLKYFLVLNKVTLYILTCLIVLVSWSKAGLAGEWILVTIDAIIFLSLFALFSSKHSLNFCLICFIPILMLCLQFALSYFNPSYRILERNEWNELNIEKALSEETSIEKIIMVSESFKNISSLSYVNPNLSHTVFFDFKNRYFDEFPKSNSSSANLIHDYEKLISLTPSGFFPTLVISNTNTLINFVHKICQLSIGIIFFLLLNERKTIRKLLFIVTINAGFLAVVGIWQKLNYSPSDNQLEILGIWDTPEPRYFFATFTYKNHWSAFALIVISIATGLLTDNFRRYGLDSFKKIKSFFIFLSIISLAISIPLSGSRSGTILLALTITILSIVILKFFAEASVKKWAILFISITISFTLLLQVGKKLHQETTHEMLNNFKIQLDQVSQGKLPLRILLWDDLIKQILQKPIYGYGFNSYRAINPIFQSKDVRDTRNMVLANAHHNYTPLIRFGHSDWLEKVSEFGILGFIIFVPYLFFLVYGLIVTNSLLSRILLVGGLIFLIYSAIDFPSQTPLCLMIFSTLLGIPLKYSCLLQKKLREH